MPRVQKRQAQGGIAAAYSFGSGSVSMPASTALCTIAAALRQRLLIAFGLYFGWPWQPHTHGKKSRRWKSIDQLLQHCHGGMEPFPPSYSPLIRRYSSSSACSASSTALSAAAPSRVSSRAATRLYAASSRVCIDWVAAEIHFVTAPVTARGCRQHSFRYTGRLLRLVAIMSSH